MTAGEQSMALAIRLGMMGNKLSYYRYGVPKSVVAELIELKKDMYADKVLRESAPYYLEVLADLIAFADAKNAGNKALADAHMANSVAKWDEIYEGLRRVIADGV